MTLTAAGAAFAGRAPAALAAETEAVQAAAALGRAARGTILVGFVGPPPSISSPALFGRIAEVHGTDALTFLDLPFPLGTTSSWVAGVDVAICHRPRLEAGVNALPLRVEPRAVIANQRHPIAAREHVTADDVVHEVFISYHPDTQPEWAAFHSLDDHRGGPPEEATADAVATTMQMVATIAGTRALTTAPYSDARLASVLMPDVVAFPLPDAAPAVISAVWREDNVNPLLEELLDAARTLDASGDGL